MPTRRTAALRRGRISSAGARYFLTFCTRNREPKLTAPVTGAALAGILARLEKDGDWELMAQTIMPDHMHILAILSGRLTVGQAVGKFKALTKPALKVARAAWQENFFEHRLRPEEAAGPYLRYIFLNPYRAQLIQRLGVWPFWRKSQTHEFDFSDSLIEDRFPPEEWLTSDVATSGLRTEDIGAD
jgi:REP element-mobilizing transposase RayT